MKVILFLLFIIFSQNVYSNDTISVSNTDNSKMSINILYPCIKGSKVVTDLQNQVNNVDELLNNIDDTTNIHKTTNIEIDEYYFYNDLNNVISSIFKKVFINLSKINLYDITYNKNSCNEINTYLQEHFTSDFSEYIFSDQMFDKGFIINTIIENVSMNEIKLQIFLWDTFEQKFLGGKYYIIRTDTKNVSQDYYNKISNMISDFIFTLTTGEKIGFFDSKIIYITETGDVRNRKKQVNIMNFDGSKNIQITKGNNLKLTPIFSKHDPNEVFYIEYIKSGVYIVKHNLKTGEISKITTKNQNMTSAPNFNPTGENQIMIAGSEENKGTNLYLFDLDRKTNRKITDNKNINTSASFSPDGKSIVYVSDKKGGRKLFIKNLETDEDTLISFGKGVYDKPSWSPDGRLIAFVKILGGKFHLGVMTTTGDGERYLTSDYLLEGVKWSPNSRYLIYTKQKGAFGKNSIPKIYIMDTITMSEFQLNTPEGVGASDPDWVIN